MDLGWNRWDFFIFCRIVFYFYKNCKANQRDKGFMMNLAVVATILGIVAFLSVIFYGIEKVSEV